jgi:hypothetical protein
VASPLEAVQEAIALDLASSGPYQTMSVVSRRSFLARPCSKPKRKRK